MGGDYEEELDNEEDIRNNISEKERNNIKKLIKSEFEEYSKKNVDDIDENNKYNYLTYYCCKSCSFDLKIIYENRVKNNI